MCEKALRFSGVLGAAVLCVALVPAASAGYTYIDFMDMEFAVIGNPGNAGNTRYPTTSGFGAVGIEYLIGKYPVTAGQYADFLNAVARTDTYGLWSSSMTGTFGAKIARSGSQGTYSYSVAADWANLPVNFVSWGDTARFANWLQNDRPTTGVQNLSTTESGAYFLDGAVSNVELMAVTRTEGAAFFIPTVHEWYKAAFYDPALNSGAGGYWDYPTASETEPTNQLLVPDPGNNANFYKDGFTTGSPYYRTEVGAFANSASAYGTYDQGGNVYEWNESVFSSGSQRGTLGGAWEFDAIRLHANQVNYNDPIYENRSYGFRIAGSISLLGGPNIEVIGASGNWGYSDEYTVGDPQDPNTTLNVTKTATNFGPFDMEIEVTGGLNPITIEEVVTNSTGVEWPGYVVQLGTGMGDTFVLSDGADLSFDGGAVEITYDGPIGISDELLLTLDIHLPHLPAGDPVIFTLRQYAIPEPGSLLLLAFGALGLLAFRRRRR